MGGSGYNPVIARKRMELESPTETDLRGPLAKRGTLSFALFPMNSSITRDGALQRARAFVLPNLRSRCSTVGAPKILANGDILRRAGLPQLARPELG